MGQVVAGIAMPESALARDAMQLIRCALSDVLFGHALRSFLFGAIAGRRRGVAFDADLLCVAALFQNAGLARKHMFSPRRFEVDGANDARDFLTARGVDAPGCERVWTAIALHTTPGIPGLMAPEIALLAAGAQMDIRGEGFDDYTPAERAAVIAAFPREANFKAELLNAYARGIELRPQTTFGTVSADVLDRWSPDFMRTNFCGLVFGSSWDT